jgi:hypothetical protein
MNDEAKSPNYDAKVVRHWGDLDGEGKTLDRVVTEFEKAVGYLEDEFVECDDGRCYRILVTVDVDEISQEEAAEWTGWDDDDEEGDGSATGRRTRWRASSRALGTCRILGEGNRR